MKTVRKISPETFFVAAVPMSVTLISRPETPRRERSSRLIDPTLVLESPAKIADSAVRE